MEESKKVLSFRLFGRRVSVMWAIGHAFAVSVIVGLITGCIMFPMPGRSWRGALPPMSAEEKALSTALQGHVRVLAEEIGERNLKYFDRLEKSAVYVEGQLSASGIKPSSYEFEVAGARPRNIELEFRGGKLAEEIIVVGAHYDSAWGTPGANDNASGTAALIELAKMLRERPHERTIRFVAFVNEEMFQTPQMGSLVYAQACRERGDEIVGMLSLETIGYYSDAEGSQAYPIGAIGWFYPKKGNFIGFIGNVGSRDLVRRSVGSFRAHAKFPSEGIAAPAAIPGIGWSDHWSFWEAGYPGVMVTDTAPFRYKHYHSPQDTPDKIDYDRMTRVVTGLAGVIEDLSR